MVGVVGYGSAGHVGKLRQQWTELIDGVQPLMPLLDLPRAMIS